MACVAAGEAVGLVGAGAPAAGAAATGAFCATMGMLGVVCVVWAAALS